MQGYPKIVATKQDFINLLNMPEFKSQAISDLQNIVNFNDDQVKQVTFSDQIIGYETYTMINNPNPLYTQKGFTTRQEAQDLIAAANAKAQTQYSN